MNNLVFLNEVIKDKIDNKLSDARQSAKDRYKSRLQERINRSKAIIQRELNKYNSDIKEEIKEEFDNDEINEKIINLKDRSSKQIISINNEKKSKTNINDTLKKLFMLNNNRPLIDFLNSIYDDNLSLNTKITYINNEEKNDCDNENFALKNIPCNLEILADDKNRKFKYKVQFQTKNSNQTAINIFKYDLELSSEKNLENDYNHDSNNNYTAKTILPKPYMILIDSNVEVPNIYRLKLELINKSTVYKFNVLKSWKYDLKRLCEKDIYLLLPLKVFDLKKRLLSIKYQIDILPKVNSEISQQEEKLRNLIKDDMFKFFKSLNIYLQKIEQKGLISSKDIDELNLISINLLNSFSNELGDIALDIKEEIQYKLKELYL